MRDLKKISTTEVERVLMADADNIDAWEAPITVPPSSGPRPEWYWQKEIGIGMSVASCGNQVDAQQVYDFVASGATGATVYEFKPSGIAGAAVDSYLVLSAVASVTSIANILWMAYDRFIAPKKPRARDSAYLQIIVQRGNETINLTLGENVSTQQALVEQLKAIVADAEKPELRLNHAAKIRELEESDLWVKIRTGNES